MLPCGWVVCVLCPLRYHVHMFLTKTKQTKPSCVVGKTRVAIVPTYDKKNRESEKLRDNQDRATDKWLNFLKLQPRMRLNSSLVLFLP